MPQAPYAVLQNVTTGASLHLSEYVSTVAKCCPPCKTIQLTALSMQLTRLVMVLPCCCRGFGVQLTKLQRPGLFSRMLQLIASQDYMCTQATKTADAQY